MVHYAKPSLGYEQNIIFLHCGTNGLSDEKNPDEIANYILNLSKSIKKDGNEDIIASIITRRTN